MCVSQYGVNLAVLLPLSTLVVTRNCTFVHNGSSMSEFPAKPVRTTDSKPRRVAVSHGRLRLRHGRQCQMRTRSRPKLLAFLLLREALSTRRNWYVAEGADGHGGVRPIVVSFVRLLSMAVPYLMQLRDCRCNGPMVCIDTPTT